MIIESESTKFLLNLLRPLNANHIENCVRRIVGILAVMQIDW